MSTKSKLEAPRSTAVQIEQKTCAVSDREGTINKKTTAQVMIPGGGALYYFGESLTSIEIRGLYLLLTRGRIP